MLKIESKIHFFPENKTRKHNSQSSWKKTAIAKIDGDIDLYYAWILERRFNLKLNRSIRGAHVTVISDRVDDKIYNQIGSMFEGKTITFEYDPAEIRTNGEHWWLKVYSMDAENIRSACGLDVKPFFGLHLTIGYAADRIDNDGNSMGGSNLEHSQYILRTIKQFNI